MWMQPNDLGQKSHKCNISCREDACDNHVETQLTLASSMVHNVGV